jgi:hypothetical protein
MKLRQLVIGTATLAAAFAAVPTIASAQAQNVTCNGTLGAITVDNLEVLEYGRCTLNGTVVLGSIDVKPFARLTATSVSVRGNVQATEAASVNVARSQIAGSFEVVQGGVARLAASTVGGEVLVDGQTGAVTIQNNRVGVGVAGNVEVFNNSGASTYIYRNTVGGNLQCKDNLPAPTGGFNTVAGNKEDQCLTL